MHYISVLVFITDDSYEIKDNSWCTPYREKLQTLSDAKRRCNDDPSCGIVYDAAGEGTKFHLCDKGATIKLSNSGAILHIKRREYIYICMSFCSVIKHNVVYRICSF